MFYGESNLIDHLHAVQRRFADFFMVLFGECLVNV